MSIQEMLNEAVELYGLSDESTISLSEKGDKEIVEQQRKAYETYIARGEMYGNKFINK